MAAIGGVAGALMAFAELFSFNPVWWLSLLFILSGILGSSRLILRQHTLLQVVVGFFLGVFCGMISILFL
jgi:membrane-associated phospholipid phosphatase